MVKRTLVVLGILVMTAISAGTVMAQGCGWAAPNCGPCPPLFVATCCPEPEWQRVVKTWSVKIEGPCPAPGLAIACGEKKKRGLCDVLGAGIPCFDWLFGGGDGVYGCTDNGDGICGPNFGPLPRLLAAGPIAVGGLFFETMW